MEGRKRRQKDLAGSKSKLGRLLNESLKTSWGSVEAHTSDLDDDIDSTIFPSDLAAMVQTLRSRILAANLSPTYPPVVLRTQLCSMLPDFTRMDRELDAMRRNNVIRIFRINTGSDDQALLLTEDYMDVLRKAASVEASNSTASHSSPSPPPRECVELLIQNVLPHHVDTAISHQRLKALLTSHQCHSTRYAAHQVDDSTLHMIHNYLEGPLKYVRSSESSQCSSSCCNDKEAPGSNTGGMVHTAADASLSVLMQLGVLSRHPSEEGWYMLCVPGIGRAIQAIKDGRKELEGLLKQRVYREIPEQQLLFKTKLKKSPLPVSFHLRDLLGYGALERIKTPGGSVIKLVKKSLMTNK
ncbi:hypothetical protein CEUSTIGMA_g7470.t1 [Chlamydomonas eustigma]|uniref:Serine-threonine protein kinase 19 n=1 Tax=Chlamydomonas eustigma TaxID=1157962 RepID=A0A250XAB7_9CHLO|nr:hypothetical protein CEUSTIGMA_g7470.t1 [Chlamydomonas eustigma]|eukprot:GAX80031.1 hypothetical protein CEUSTIGMA_g7470.t1 [Chlamydomonas eustigma]